MAFKNRFYPHLLPDDIELWERFLKVRGDQYDSFDYDIRIGKGRDPGTNVDSKIRRMGIELSQRRIDAIGHRPGSLTVIEITLSAGLKAVGQLLTYPDLYKLTYNPTLPVKTLLVAAEIQPDINQALIAHGIPWILLP